jgi:hypothetical protein
MSITITTDVFCDGDGCGTWTGGVTGFIANPVAARWQAKGKGWKRINRKDLCPACAEKYRIEHKEAKC